MDKSESEWQQIVIDIGPRLYRYFLGSFAAHVASDLVQETLIRLVQKHRDGEFDPAKGNITAYAFGIARFVRMESLKDKKRFDLVGDEATLEGAMAEPKTCDSDNLSHLRWAIGQLKPIEQELVLMMIDKDASMEKISSEFNMPVGTVKNHIHRAKEKLREIMEVNV